MRDLCHVAGLAGLIIRGRKVSGQVAVPVPAAGSVGSDHLVPAEMKPLCVCVCHAQCQQMEKDLV